MHINVPEPIDLVRRIYRSNTSTTYLGIDSGKAKKAVKIFNRSGVAREMAFIEKRASTIIRTANQAVSSSLVLAHHYDFGDRTIAIAPYILGVSIRDIIDNLDMISLIEQQNITKVSISVALDVGIDACQALAVLHQKAYSYEGVQTGFVHSDICPRNLHVSSEGKTHVLDLGACLPQTVTKQTQGSIFCKSDYCSPEQARVDSYDSCSDQFSLGIVLYEIITGKHPFLVFPGMSSSDIRARIMVEKPFEPREINKCLPSSLRAIVYHLLEKDSNKRYENIKTLESALQEAKQEWQKKNVPVDLGRGVQTLLRLVDVSDTKPVQVYSADPECVVQNSI